MCENAKVTEEEGNPGKTRGFNFDPLPMQSPILVVGFVISLPRRNESLLYLSPYHFSQRSQAGMTVTKV